MFHKILTPSMAKILNSLYTFFSRIFYIARILWFFGYKNKHFYIWVNSLSVKDEVDGFYMCHSRWDRTTWNLETSGSMSLGVII